jgi:hypothetical protein
LGTRNEQNQWLEHWCDWFYRVKKHLLLDPDATLSNQQRAYLIVAIDRDAIAGELFGTQLPPGEGRDATRRVICKLDALSARLCDGLLATTFPLYSMDDSGPSKGWTDLLGPR